ncbi:PilC/PilY family type IV pilus protein [Curvibacter sp. RS43]|uniref:pilus assembly protein n=1 Tax=Curvibacter microcysteis TaxID=3026419 RepID=UPI0023619153|nr:PilC/PilY family type IV pilus protein [Curvibacter sp. RS43]MDD0812584.1 PilC/PilY family type IV pilus protein [Curvibacter sp. RS43]
MTPPNRAPLWVWILALGLSQGSQASLTDLASAPLETASPGQVKPNILFVLDDSGSMVWDYLPDWANTGNPALFRNSRYNGLYYNAAITYSPPQNHDGSEYPSMNASYTSGWTKVPDDGFGVQSGATSSLVNKASYYTFVAGEYCTDVHQANCKAMSAPSASHPFPAYLRWCADAALSTCQINYVNTAPPNGKTYTQPRYPALSYVSGYSVQTVPGANLLTTLVPSNNAYTYPGTSAKASTRTDCSASTCSYAEEMNNYANWWAYYRTRMQMMKTAATQAFSSLGSNYRLGYMSINNNTGSDFLNMADLSTGSGGQKAMWFSKFTKARPGGATPLRTTLATAGRYYGGKLSSINGVSATDPMQYACQRNYTILSTDGYWNELSTPVRLDGGTPVGDQDGGAARPYLDPNATANTLADVAYYYYSTDLRSPAFNNTLNTSGVDVSSNSVADGQQRMYTSTLGLGASGYMLFQEGYTSLSAGDYYDVSVGTSASPSNAANGICSWQTSGSCGWPGAVSNTQTTIDDLWHTAVNGRGVYYSASNANSLKTGLNNFLSSVQAATSNSAASTSSTPNVSATNNFVFKSNFRSVDWYGELTRSTIDVRTGTLSSYVDWSESGTANSSANTAASARLDNLSPAARNLYTYNGSVGLLQTFTWDALTEAQKAFFQISGGGISSLSQLCAVGTLCIPSAAQVDSSQAGTNTGAGGINLVNFLRGDRSNESSDASKYYRARTHVLGDLVDSQPVYVSSPQFSYKDNGYAAFKAAQGSRQGMVYVGSNDGMLHAFNASTGVESWAYIPSLLLPHLYKLADKNYASNHSHYVNATPKTGDVYFDDDWHTVLIGGLGAGGRGFYALDITNPGSPTVLWEFTHDTRKTTGYTTDADLGYSYGIPVITKLSDGTWVVIVSSGYNNVSPGSGHGIVWILNAKTGAILKKIDTGAGSSSAAVPGCSTAPCPAGLAQLSAYVDNASTNNLALRLYGGDLLGHVWRIDLSELSASNAASTPVVPQLLATLADANGTRQPITTRPELGYSQGNYLVFVGTGQLLGLNDLTSSQTQSLYALKDPLTKPSGPSGLYPNPRSTLCSTSIKTQCFVKQLLNNSGGGRSATSTVSYAVDLSSMSGWLIDLPVSGERVSTDMDLQLGTLAFTTNIPSTGTGCNVGGSSYLNYLNYSNGLAVGTGSSTGVLLSSGTSTGLSSGLSLVRLANGKVVAITNLSDGTSQTNTLPISSAGSSTRRVSWRELTVQ